MSKSPVIVIGIDGAEPRLMEKWIREGYLPSIGEIINEGTGLCHLASTANAMSPSAWTTFRTGLNPGRHGIFYFLDKVPGKYKICYSLDKISSLKSFWKYAGEYGKKIAVLHFPLGYPAEGINGIEVSGWLSPSMQSDGFTYPPSLAQNIIDQVPEFKIHWPFKELLNIGRYEEALELKLKSIKAKSKLHRLLLNNGNWDLVIVVFEEVDQLQHFFWHFMDKNHPKYKKSTKSKLKEAILSAYIAIDKAIGDLKRLFGKDSRYIFLSDHGFKANTYGPVYVSDLLKKAGYQSEKKSVISKISKYSYGAAEFLPTKIKHLLSHTLPWVRKGMLESRCFAKIQWDKTAAYTIYLNRTSEIWLNLKERDEKGIVPLNNYMSLCEELIDFLLNCREKSSSRHPIRAVLRKEDVYAGDLINIAPDLTLKWAHDVFVNGIKFFKKNKEIIANNPVENDIRTGEHSDYGIFADNALEKSLNYINIIDVPPHILHAMGIEIPDWMEGNPYNIQEQKIARVKNDYVKSNFKFGYSAEEEKQIEEKLKDVGYL